ncbi:cytochrome B5 [Apiospora hydei]|uniref:Cytochrome B5 n=1 Tax=Apiospora hydei TaxID=1337664 RepID=A0ABR1X4P8_9PEZI
MLPASGPRPLQAGLCRETATGDSVTVTADPPSNTQEHQLKPVSPTSSATSTYNIFDAVEGPEGSREEETEKRPRIYTTQEVTEHKSEKDLWIVIGSDVYDVTEFQHQHPGGATVMRGVAGKDATKKFDKHHRRGILEPYKPKYRVGVLAVVSSSTGNGKQAGDGGVSKRKGGCFVGCGVLFPGS